jgi:hypothetical protein
LKTSYEQTVVLVVAFFSITASWFFYLIDIRLHVMLTAWRLSSAL